MTLSKARKEYLDFLEAGNGKVQLLLGQQPSLLEKQKLLLDQLEVSYREWVERGIQRSKAKRRSEVWANRIIVVGAYTAGTIVGVHLW